MAFLSVKDKDSFLRDTKGVIHVGAHLGEERYLYDFHITNNSGSSSIFETKLHEIAWPETQKIKTISLESITLDTFFL